MITFLEGVGWLKLRNRKTRFKSCKGNDSLKGQAQGIGAGALPLRGLVPGAAHLSPRGGKKDKCSGIQKAGTPTPAQCIPPGYLGKLLDLHQGRGSRLLQKNEEDYSGAGKTNPGNSRAF